MAGGSSTQAAMSVHWECHLTVKSATRQSKVGKILLKYFHQLKLFSLLDGQSGIGNTEETCLE